MAGELRVFAGPEHQPFKLGDGCSGAALLIHGFPGTPAEMRGLGEWLAQHGWAAHGILLPGFGPDIQHLRTCTRADWVQAAQTAWDEVRRINSQALLVGFSMGAAVALNLDIQSQDRLILAAPFWQNAAWLAPLVGLLRRLKPELAPFKKADFSDPRLREQMIRILPDIDIDDPEIQQIIRERFVLPVRAAEETLRLGREAYHRAGLLDCETLVLQGAEDFLVKSKNTRKLVQRLSKGRTTYLEIDSGHNLLSCCGPLQDAVYEAVGRFLKVGEK